MQRIVFLIAGAAALTGCTMGPPQGDAMAGQQQLAQLLAGKVAGPRVECVPTFHAGSGTVLTPQAIALDVNPGLTYVSNTAGSGCEGIVGTRYSLVTTSHGTTGLCAGDQVQIRDLQTGLFAGACTLEPFVPYRRP